MWPDTTRSRPPLGLPNGSVRAVLTLVILAVVCVRTARGEGDDAFWNDTFLVLLATYYAARGTVKIPSETLGKLQAEGAVPKEANPLFLPKGIVRAIIAAAVVGVGAYLFREGRFAEVSIDNLAPLAPYEALIVVAIYLLGVVSAGLANLVAKLRRKRAAPAWRDAKAILALMAVAAVAIAYFIGSPLPEAFEKGSLAFVLFYFGSR